jgi:hypothetical protein
MGDSLYVNPTGRNISGHQDFYTPAAKAIKRLRPCSLALPSMQGDDAAAGLCQVLRQTVRT